jgi:hypothetical protein
MSDFDIVVSLALGVGLAAAVGFRVFVPLLVMSGAAYTGHLTLSDSSPGSPRRPRSRC